MEEQEVFRIIRIVRRNEPYLRQVVIDLSIAEDKNGLYIIAHLEKPTEESMGLPKTIEGIRVKKHVL